ncbi:MBL fold metallo-hydrolase [Robertmurraya massiliosenegalensis]|uniref:MBL fold metallo-hydrolase n=1 Tax=Robertmurraya TaxID=2837507 RepID=UPI0039A6E511
MKNFIITIATILFLVGCNAQQPSSVQKEIESPANPTITEQTDNDASSSPPAIEQDKTMNEELKVHFLDVGQADSTLFQVSEDGQSYTILIDSGDFTGDEVVDYLQKNKVKNINIAIGTHPDADHIGQLDQVLQTFPVDEVWLSGNTSQSDTFQRVLMEISENDVDYVEPRTGDTYEIGPLHLEVLYPKEITGKANEESISVIITYGEISFVFTGDAEKANEIEMIQSGSQLEATFLQLGHHGSTTSTSKEFLQAVQPEVAIYSAGMDNSYGHPHEEVVSLIQESGIPLYGTDVHGTIIVTTDGKTYQIETEKDGYIEERKSKQQIDTNNRVENQDSCININTASAEEVEEIIHIGPERAKDLIELRPYQSIEELTKINGIGQARVDDIKKEGLACIGGN